jgi:hypothetical protein
MKEKIEALVELSGIRKAWMMMTEQLPYMSKILPEEALVAFTLKYFEETFSEEEIDFLAEFHANPIAKTIMTKFMHVMPAMQTSMQKFCADRIENMTPLEREELFEDLTLSYGDHE